MECFELGLINDTHTGGLRLNFGNRHGALELVHQMAKGEGFGHIVGQGVRKMKDIFANDFSADPKIMQDIGMEAKGLEFSEYMTKESLAQQGGYGLALKGPQHDEAWLIFMDMVHDFIPTFEQKAELFPRLNRKPKHCTGFRCFAPGSAFVVYVNFPGTTLYRKTTKIHPSLPRS
jgi:aldehyde:ferredoxin oxidoreductase